jgi:hypothetical protein
MRRFLPLSAVLLLVAAAYCGQAVAQESTGRGDAVYGCGMMGGGMMGGGMMGGMLWGMANEYDWEKIGDELSLSADQKNKIMMQSRDTVRMMMEHKNDLSLKMFDLNTELRMGEPDKMKVNKLVDEIAALEKQILQDRVKAVEDLHMTLSADQWNRFKQLPMMSGEHMRMMRGGGGGHMMR